MTVTYTVAVDWNDDGDFSGISADVLALTWRLGMDAPYDSVAAPISARITVRNHNRAYSPEYAAVLPGKPIRIQSDDGTTTRTHFTGFISRVEPQPGNQGQRTAVIHAHGIEHSLSDTAVSMPLQVNARADTVIGAVLDAVPLRRPVMHGRWVLGIADYSEIGTNTHLPDEYPRSLEQGKSTFAYIADTWADGIPALNAIREAAASERGRFFIDRTGQAVFYNRHHEILSTDSAATFADNMDGLTYDYGSGIVNHVRVSLLPRSVGDEGAVLWRVETPLELLPGDRRWIAPFRDENGRPIGALNVIRPAAGFDYSANTNRDGSGQDMTARLQMHVEVDASAVTIEVRNEAHVVVYLLAGFQVRGTPLLQGDPLTIEMTDYVSETFYGRSTMAFTLSALESMEQAENVARYELVRRAEPRGNAHTLTLQGRQHMPEILARTLFDRITVIDSQTNHHADYFIVAEEHTVTLGGARHRVEWTLEQVPGVFWILGTSELNQTTTLAY